MVKDAFESVSITTNSGVEPGLILILLFVITALLFGIPAIIKKSIKGILLAIFCTVFATLGTYIMLF